MQASKASVSESVSVFRTLGPLLFIIYIDDIDNYVAGKILKFAVYSEEDVSALQFDLCNLDEWSEEWQMLFNADKCRVMHMHMGYNSQ